MGQVDYYELLGVGQHVPQETLKRAFRSRLISLHPDQNPGDALAAERTRQIVEAYDFSINVILFIISLLTLNLHNSILLNSF